MTRKKYNKEFKTQVVKQVIEEGKKTTQIAKELDLSKDLVYRWINEYETMEMKLLVATKMLTEIANSK